MALLQNTVAPLNKDTLHVDNYTKLSAVLSFVERLSSCRGSQRILVPLYIDNISVSLSWRVD